MLTKRCNKCSYVKNGVRCRKEASCHIGCNIFCRMHGYASPGRCADVSFDDVITQLEKKVSNLQALQSDYEDVGLAEILRDTLENLEQMRVIQENTAMMLQSRPLYSNDVHPT